MKNNYPLKYLIKKVRGIKIGELKTNLKQSIQKIDMNTIRKAFYISTLSLLVFTLGFSIRTRHMIQQKLIKQSYAASIVDYNYVNKNTDKVTSRGGIFRFKAANDDTEKQETVAVNENKEEPKEEVKEKTIEELVNDVETGKAGNGQDRVNYLGDKYDEVMKIINERYKEEPKKQDNTKAQVATSGDKATYQQYAHSQFEKYGWSDYDFECLVKLWTKESNWNPNSHNSSSGAHGIPQALPASKMASYGDDYMTNYVTQINWGLDYIKGRYGSPSNAWDHFLSHNWY